MVDKKLHGALLDTAVDMNRLGLNQGTSGNISVRDGDGFLITPSALAYEQCKPGDMVWVDLFGQAHGARKPSTEWRIHRDIYTQHEQAGAVLHAHAPWSTTLACLEKPIPPFHYMVAIAGGHSIPCAPYATFGTQELSDNIAKALVSHRACLMAHHGLLCFGGQLEEVLALAVEVEALAQMYVQALQIEEPPLLSQEEMEQILVQFKSYKA